MGVLDLSDAYDWVFQLGEHPPRFELGVVLYTVLGTLDGHGSDPGVLAPLHNIVLVQRASPRLNALVQRLLILESAS